MGHKDATRVLGETTEIIHMTIKRCPNCSHILASPVLTEKKTIFDIQSLQNVKATEYNFYEYSCSNCGSEVKSVHRDYSLAGDMVSIS